MNNKTVRTVAYISITVLASVMLVVILYCFGPHNEKRFGERAVGWGSIPIIQDPYTFNENGPYMSKYKVHVDPQNECICIGFLIEGENEICDPDEIIMMSFNGNGRRIYRAPFGHFRETRNAINAYKELVKDGAYVYTYSKDKYGLSLFVICPMDDIFKDPAGFNTMTIGFKDIYDVEGNCITTDEGHSDWIFFANRHGRIVPDDDLFYVDTEELRNVTEGADARVILTPKVDGVEFLDIDEGVSLSLDRIKHGISLEGLDADVSLSNEQDGNGDEVMVITLKNIRNIMTGRHEIHIPKGLARGWREGIRCSSGEISQPFLIEGKEEESDE